MSANLQGAEPPPSLPRPRELTLKQRLFIEAYCGRARGNATEAARLANYDGTDVTLATVGCENLRKPQIKDAINDWFDSRAMHPSEITAELSDIGRAEWRNFLTIRYDNEGNTIGAKLNLSDKIKALDLLAKIRRMTGPETVTIDHSESIEAMRAAVQMCAAALQIGFFDAIQRFLANCEGTRTEYILRQLAESEAPDETP
jgi:hypothetical protein